MRRCVCLCHNLKSNTVNLMVDNKLIYTHSGNSNLDRFLNCTGIDELDVIIKPTITKTIPKDGFRVSDFTQDSIGYVCVISENDVNNLHSLAKAFKVPNVKVFNYLDLVSLKLSNYDKIIALVNWDEFKVALVYLEFGVVKGFKLSTESKLTYNISKFVEKYKCDVVEELSVYNEELLKNRISNVSSLKDFELFTIQHLPYLLDLKGVSILNDSDDGIIDEVENEDSFDVNDNQPNDKEENKSPNGIKGFLGRLFGKKSKKEPAGNLTESFSNYDDDFKRQMDLNKITVDDNGTSFYQNVGSLGYESSVLVAREKTAGDYLFIVFIILVISCLLFSFGFSTLYRMKINSLSSRNSSIESSLSLLSFKNKDNTHSTVNRVLDLASSEVPNGCEVSKVGYGDDNVYLMEVTSEEPVEDTSALTKGLPNDVVVSDIASNNNIGTANNPIKAGIIYAITLVTP